MSEVPAADGDLDAGADADANAEAHVLKAQARPLDSWYYVKSPLPSTPLRVGENLEAFFEKLERINFEVQASQARTPRNWRLLRPNSWSGSETMWRKFSTKFKNVENFEKIEKFECFESYKSLQNVKSLKAWTRWNLWNFGGLKRLKTRGVCKVWMFDKNEIFATFEKFEGLKSLNSLKVWNLSNFESVKVKVWNLSNFESVKVWTFEKLEKFAKRLDKIQTS